MLNDLLEKKNHIVDTLNDKGKKERLFYIIINLASYVLSALAMFEFIYELCNMIGCIVSGTPSEAIKELIRVLPVILMTASFITIGISSHNAYVAVSKEKRVHIWKKNSLSLMVMGAIISLYVMIGVIAKIYGSIVEGNLSLLFPLDIMIAGALIFVYGFFGKKYASVIANKGTELPFHKELSLKGLDKFFNGFIYLVSTFSFGAICYGVVCMDFTHGGIFYNIMLLAFYGAAVLMYFLYRFVYCEVKEELKHRTTLFMGIKLLAFNLVLFILYLVSVNVYNEAPNQNAFAILPIEFTASFNAFGVLMPLANLAAPAVAILKGIFKKKNAKY